MREQNTHLVIVVDDPFVVFVDVFVCDWNELSPPAYSLQFESFDGDAPKAVTMGTSAGATPSPLPGVAPSPRLVCRPTPHRDVSWKSIRLRSLRSPYPNHGSAR